MRTHLVAVAALLALLLAVFGVAVSRSATANTTSETKSYLPYVSKPFPTPTSTNTPIPTATPVIPTATPTIIPTATPTTVAPPTGCTVCTSDTYNCSHFSTQAQAQACHDYCFAQVGYDVHRLDADGDGEACESLPDEPFTPLLNFVPTGE